MKTFLRLTILLVVLAAGIVTWHYRQQWGLVTGTTTSTTTTTAPPIAPLTGLPDPGGASLHRAALTIKVENTPMARPQWGIEHADVVYEEIVEGGITRLAAIFNSQVPARVGPVRSVRRTDQSIVWPIGGIFAFSGGAPYAVQSINTAPVNIFSESRAGAGMFRDHTRFPPHNLYAVPSVLFSYGGTPTPPPPLFSYLRAGDKIHGSKVTTINVGLRGGYATSYDWNKKTKSWDRTIFGAPDVTASQVRVSPTNFIVMWITYQGGVGVMGAEGQMVGTGQAAVFTGGREVVGTWSRATKSVPVSFHDTQGRLIRLTPGTTWVTLAAVGDPVTTTP